jgi:hypothetical protein
VCLWVCLCIPLILLCNNSVNTFLRQRRIVGGIVFYALRIVWKERRPLLLPRTSFFGGGRGSFWRLVPSVYIDETGSVPRYSLQMFHPFLFIVVLLLYCMGKYKENSPKGHDFAGFKAVSCPAAMNMNCCCPLSFAIKRVACNTGHTICCLFPVKSHLWM